MIKLHEVRRIIIRQRANVRGAQSSGPPGRHWSTCRIPEHAISRARARDRLRAFRPDTGARSLFLLVAPSSRSQTKPETTQTGCGTSEDTARRYFWQLLSGVGYCHCNGVCHRSSRSATHRAAFMLRRFYATADPPQGSEARESVAVRRQRVHDAESASGPNARLRERACDLSTRCAQIADFGALCERFAIAAGSDDDEKASALFTALAARSPFEVRRRFASLCRAGGHDGRVSKVSH